MDDDSPPGLGFYLEATLIGALTLFGIVTGLINFGRWILSL